uniref:KIB1-4 beta-propeller domain-containing protein n=1 Tax=Oryza punctata TaxID=4537 RepID=A0A0E0LQ18_ORYPU
MLDMLTKECFLLSFTSPSKIIPLPPLVDIPRLDLIFNCALSSQTPPDCTVMLAVCRDKSLLYCRPDDTHWSRLPIDNFACDDGDEFDGGIVGYQGKFYATGIHFLLMPHLLHHHLPLRGATLSFRCHVPTPKDSVYRGYLVASCGDIFFVRSYLFGIPDEIVNLEIYHWNPSQDGWNTLHSIGDRTFFLGRNSSVVSSATRAGTEPNCIHILRSVNRKYKKEEKGHDKKIVCSSTEWGQWSNLCLDLVELLVPNISFIDFLHMKAACKQWRSISSRIQDSKVLPLLLTTRPGRRDSLEVFDLMSKKNYSINVSIPGPTSGDDTGASQSQILHFAKNGWVILSRGNHSFFLVNPFKNSPDHVIALPPIRSFDFKGISFFSVPESPDFVVVAIESIRSSTVVTMKTWRIGDEDWKEERFENDIPFFMASHNPVFFEGEFYCLDVSGKLGTFDPDTMEWGVFDELDPVDDQLLSTDYGYSHLMEWKGELVAFFRQCGAEDGSMSFFKLDPTQMVWSELDGLKDGIMFWGRTNVVARSPPPGEDHLCNKMFIPNFSESDGGREHGFYCLEKK